METNLEQTWTGEDTICALATATGGAIAVIRVSGPSAISVVSTICTSNFTDSAANTIHYTRLTDGSEIIDEVMVAVFRAPHSYTGEDSVEISCHGSAYIVSRILELLIRNGCRMAKPGEYTMRAYLNGKLDLTQAEAVADLIASTNKATHQMAMSQLRGHFSSELANLREQLLKLTSLLELELDFSDHEDLEFADRKELTELANKIDKHITKLAQSFEMGQALKKGIPVAIVGKTNVGKSTLLNRLLHDERAIVSDIHGTTRDTIEDAIDLNGITFRFIDTAGIRQTTDAIEQIGIDRTYQAIAKARIVLWLIDKQPTHEEIKEIQERCSGKSLIVIRNKIDKENDSLASCDSSFSIPHASFIRISAKQNLNIDQLQSAICQSVNIPTLSDSDVIVTSARHYQALMCAHDNLTHVIESLAQQLSGDLVAEDLRQVLADLSEITGKGQITTPEVLRNIFKNFCVGK